MSHLGKVLVSFGIILIVVGLVLSYRVNIPFLKKLGHLPGDIIIKRENFTFYFPLVTCLILSLILYFIVNLLRR
jgi:hypothetical protein